jgi:signal transduction histidine kinase
VKRIRAGLLSVVAWTVPGLLTGAIVVLVFPVSPQQHAYVGRFAAGFLASWWIWAALSPLTRAAARRVPIERPLARPLAIHLVFGVAAALVFSLWFTWMLWLTRAPTLPPEPYAVGFRRFVMGHIAAGIAVYATVVAVSTTIDERAARRQRELDTARLEADLAQAQLRALQMQLQPHFLFNTLHGIAMLTDTDPAAAETMAVKLAELLRTTLRLRDVPEVPLRTELELLRAYLEIEELRFGDRLSVTFAVPEHLLDVSVPSFLLQPIVENAVRHGISPRVAAGRIAIGAARDAGAIVLSVEDNGAGFDRDPFMIEGVGLSATRERLALRYGAAGSIQCERGSAETSGARVAIRIPLDGARSN